MIRRPPISTLFPSRRSSDLDRNLWSWTILKAWSQNAGEVRLRSADPCCPPDINFHYFERRQGNKWRSEEHTSELQSRPHLVCRLLLEKKNDLDHRQKPVTPE